MDMTTYKALADCRIGGMFRKAGEVFSMPALEKVPRHLEEVTARKVAVEPERTGGAGEPAGMMPEDMGMGEPTSAAEYTAGDILKRGNKKNK